MSKRFTLSKDNKAIDLDKISSDAQAVATRKDFKDHTDPAYIGPGVWIAIHTRAKLATTPARKADFIDFMKTICYNFPCDNCKLHCSDYIANNPMEDYLDRTVEMNGKILDIGLFVWAWQFHNAVNARLKKPIMSWQTIYDIHFSENKICSQACMATVSTVPSANKHKPELAPVTLVTPISSDTSKSSTSSSLSTPFMSNTSTPKSFKLIPVSRKYV